MNKNFQAIKSAYGYRADGDRSDEVASQTYVSLKEERNNKVQLLRGLAIIAVVMIHTLTGEDWQMFCGPFVNFAVATFLFLSGYLTKLENENWRAFYRKRIVRVLIPYIVWSVLYSWKAVSRADVESLFFNLLTGEACFHLYYIVVYVQFVLLTPLLGKLAKSRFRSLGWLVTPIIVLLVSLAGWLPKLESYKAVCLFWFAYYYLGLVLGNGLVVKHYRLGALFTLLLASLPLQMGEDYAWLQMDETYWGSQLKLTALLTNTLFLLTAHVLLQRRDFEPRSRLLRSLGDYSFGIYLSHVFIIMVLEKIPYFFHLPFPLNSVIVVLAGLSCCHIGYLICGPRVSRWAGLR